MRLRELFEHKKGIRAKKYNKKPKKFIEPIKPKKAEAPHTTEDLDEGWKTKVAGATMAAANLLGSPAHAGDVQYNLPDIVAHITMTVNGKTVEKEINLGTEYQSPAEAEKAVAKWLKEKGIKSYRIDLQRANTNEGWKDWVAGAAIGAAALGAHGDAEAAKKKHVEKPSITQQAKADPKVDKRVADIKKQVNAPSNITTTGISMNSGPEHLVQKEAIKSGIKGTELAQFLAQVRHESADFSRMKEIGGSLDFKKYDPKHAPKTAKILGNKHAGDGARYKGRGYIQITGRDNYRMAGDAIGLPLEEKPELAATPEVAAKIAVWYWKTRVKPSVNNFDDTAAVTKKINPALRGLADRISHFKDYKNILNIG